MLLEHEADGGGSMVEPAALKGDFGEALAQAAWAWSRKEDNFGMPRYVDPLEGWIADATLIPSA